MSEDTPCPQPGVDPPTISQEWLEEVQAHLRHSVAGCDLHAQPSPAASAASGMSDDANPRPLFQVLVGAGAASYDGEARRLVRMGRVTVNGDVAMDEEAPISGALVGVTDPECPVLTVAVRHGCTVLIGATAGLLTHPNASRAVITLGDGGEVIGVRLICDVPAQPSHPSFAAEQP